jgi:predicted RNase H-like HicB family nuclease
MIETLESPIISADSVSARPAAPAFRYDVVVGPEVADGQVLYVASHPDLEFVRGQGSTVEEAIEALAEVADEYVRDMTASGVPIPPFSDDPQISVFELLQPRPVLQRLEVDWVVRRF